MAGAESSTDRMKTKKGLWDLAIWSLLIPEKSGFLTGEAVWSPIIWKCEFQNMLTNAYAQPTLQSH